MKSTLNKNKSNIIKIALSAGPQNFNSFTMYPPIILLFTDMIILLNI